jgi:hypothetical protein
MVSRSSGNPDDDPARFTDRRVDLFWRTLDADIGSDPAEAVRGYLRHPRNSTPSHLAQRAVVLLCPKARIGEFVWPIYFYRCPEEELVWIRYLRSTLWALALTSR